MTSSRRLIAEVVLAAVNLRGELLDRLRAAVLGLDLQPEQASVFGSFARSEATADRDIDLFLLMPAA